MQVKLTIGERLKDLRTAQKLTLEQLAAEVGISLKIHHSGIHSVLRLALRAQFLMTHSHDRL